MKLTDGLQAVTRLGIDTAPVIYFVEAEPRYAALVAAVFDLLGSTLLGITPVITLGEALVHLFASGDVRLQTAYRSFLLRSAGLETRPIDSIIVERAAALRAHYRVHLTDALQIAVALEAGCEAFLTNDRTLKRVTELRVLVLDELEL
jgi:predicted nucleic acid-binding protein